MRVLIVTRMWPTARRPHDGTFVAEEVRALAKLGTDIKVLHGFGGPPALPYMRLATTVRATVHREHFDIVHAHYGTAGFSATVQRTVPTVVTFHGSDLQGRRRWDGSVTLGGRVETVLAQRAARRAAACIVVSPALQRQLGVAEAHVIAPGIADDIFKPVHQEEAFRRLGLEDSKRKRIIFVGDPAKPVKRFSLAEAAVARMNEMGIAADLIPVYNRSQSEVAAWMNACDGLVLTSFSEASPMVIKEGLACGTPIVSVDVGDVRAQLAAVPTGRVVEADPAPIAEALVEISGVSRPRRAAREIQTLTGDYAAREVRKIYDQALEASRVN